MPLYLRKRIKIAPGLALNLSKNGLGLSAGPRGFKVSHGPRGTQINAGRGGLYYRKTLNAKSKKRSKAAGQIHIQVRVPQPAPPPVRYVRFARPRVGLPGAVDHLRARAPWLFWSMMACGLLLMMLATPR